jgi:hypothetical protein
LDLSTDPAGVFEDVLIALGIGTLLAGGGAAAAKMKCDPVTIGVFPDSKGGIGVGIQIH